MCFGKSYKKKPTAGKDLKNRTEMIQPPGRKQPKGILKNYLKGTDII